MMMHDPQVAKNLGTWYEIEWHQFAGTPLGVQGLAAGTLDCATVGGLSVANGLDKGADIVILGEFIEERSTQRLDVVDGPQGLRHRLARRPARARRSRPSRSAGRPTTCRTTTSSGRPGLKAGPRLQEGRGPVRADAGDAARRARRHGRVPAAVLRRGQRDRRREADVPAHRPDRPVRPAPQRVPARLRRGARGGDRASSRRTGRGSRAGSRSRRNRDKVIEASAAATKIPADVLDRFLLTEQDYYRPPSGGVNVAGAAGASGTSSASAEASRATWR